MMLLLNIVFFILNILFGIKGHENKRYVQSHFSFFVAGMNFLASIAEIVRHYI